MFAPLNVYAKHIHKESVYRDAWCTGKTEVRLLNGNRADCIIKGYAVEVEFANKYHQAIGQSLDYSEQTGLLPGILIIVEKNKDWRYYNKLMPVAHKNGIKVWYITPKQIKD